MNVGRVERKRRRFSDLAILLGVIAGVAIAYLMIRAADQKPRDIPEAKLSSTPTARKARQTVMPARGDKLVIDIDRNELLRRTEPLGNPVHTTLQKSETVVEQIATPYFTSGGIYRVSTRPPERPRVYNLGIWGSDGVILLNEDPEAFYDLVDNAGLRFTAGSDRVAYVVTYLEATSGFKRHPQILRSMEEAWWIPKPDAEESRKRDQMIEKYGPVVQQPKLSSDGEAVVIYAISDLKLVCITAKVSSDGRIQISEKVLEEHTPTVMMN